MSVGGELRAAMSGARQLLAPFGLEERARRLLGRAGLVIERKADRSEMARERDELRREVLDLRHLRGSAGDQGDLVENRPKPAFAHWGEDQILMWLFENRPKGLYVDVGAFHPSLFSNTRLLFDRGWSGINIDCNPAMIALYQQSRPTDVNLNVAVANREGTARFFFFGDWASSNTISPAFASQISEGQNIAVKREIELPCHPLRSVLERHLRPGETMDFLNIDVEGVDLEVLESNDWDRYRPLVVAVEDIEFSFEAPEHSGSYRFLRQQGYRAISRTIYTNFFVDERRREQLNGCP